MRGMTLDETFLIPVQPERYTPDASTTSEYSIHVCARYILITSVMYGILIISQRLAGMEDAGSGFQMHSIIWACQLILPRARLTLQEMRQPTIPHPLPYAPPDLVGETLPNQETP